MNGIGLTQDWHWIGIGLGVDWQIGNESTKDWKIGTVLASDCHWICTGLAIYGSSVWNGSRLARPLPIECQSMSVWILPVLTWRCRLGAEVDD